MLTSEQIIKELEIEKQIWNDAIEAAIKVAEELAHYHVSEAIQEIRKLKK